MNLYSFSVLCFSFGVTLTAILVFVKRRDQVAHRFIFFSLAICGWSYLFSIWISQQFSSEMTFLLMRIAYVPLMFIPTTWLHLVFVLIGKREPVKHFYLTNYFISFFFSLFCLTRQMIAGMGTYLEFKFFPIAGPLHHFHVTHFVALVFFGFYFLLKKYFNSEGAERDQLRYFIWGALVGFLSGGSIYITYYRIPLPMYYLVLMPLYPIFTGIALIKYGLFDVQEIADAFQREKMTALGIMAASLNHELRNPLYIAKGRIETYLDGVERQVYKTPEVRQTNADTVLNSASSQLQRMMDIMQRFSDFAKPFNAKKEKQAVELVPLVRDVRELVSHEFETCQIILKENIQPALQILGNRRQLEEVLVNLMMNAIQAIKQATSHRPQAEAKEKLQAEQATSSMPQAKAKDTLQFEACGLQPEAGTIELSAEKMNGNIRIQIKDNGPGMDAERLARIFEPFFTTKDEGTGLGLYITKQLVERNGGKMEVRSKKGGGTVFTLTFRAPETVKKDSKS